MSKKQNKKILVTGGAGFIGSHLVDRLIKENYKVADAIFGLKTDTGVKKFQGDKGLVSDGIVGKNTRAELNKLLGK